MTAIGALATSCSTALPSMGQTPVRESDTPTLLDIQTGRSCESGRLLGNVFSLYLSDSRWLEESVHPRLVCRYTVNTQMACGELPTLMSDFTSCCCSICCPGPRWCGCAIVLQQVLANIGYDHVNNSGIKVSTGHGVRGTCCTCASVWDWYVQLLLVTVPIRAAACLLTILEQKLLPLQ